MYQLFLPYKLAVKAKAKGFNEKCIAEYIDNGIFTVYQQDISGIDIHPTINELFNTNTNSSPNYHSEYNPICAPMYQQIIDWFLDKHKIHLSLLLDGGVEYPCWRMCYDDMNETIVRNNVEVYSHDEIGAINNKQEAWNHLIEYALDNFIN